MKKNANKGFSLVELIIVIAIMAVLIGVLAPQFVKYIEKSRESTDITNLDSIVEVVVSYLADKDNPPTSVVVDGSSGTFELTLTGGDTTNITADKILEFGGCKGVKLKSSKWKSDKPLKATITTSTGKVEYEGEADRFVAKSDKTGYDSQ